MTVAGCANREGTADYHPSEHVPAPPEVVGSTPPPTAAPRKAVDAPTGGDHQATRRTSKPDPSTPRQKKVGERSEATRTGGEGLNETGIVAQTPADSSSGQAVLDAYSAKMFSILRAGGAEAKFRTDLRAAGPKIARSHSFRPFLPIYEAYARAVRGAATKLEELPAPAPAENVGKAMVAYLRALSHNLDSSVEAMKAGDGAKAVELSNERKPLIAAQMAKVFETVKEDGFDEAAFRTNCRLTHVR